MTVTELGARWDLAAVCTPADADVMHPPTNRAKDTAPGKRLCAACPVRQQCLDNAMEEEGSAGLADRHGIRGGLTRNERHALHRQRNPAMNRGGRKAAKCGTNSAYDRHVRLGEPIDDDCREAHTRKSQADRAKRKARQSGTRRAAA